MNLYRDDCDRREDGGNLSAVMTATQAALTDGELVKRVAGGDKAAIRLLFHRHHARVFRFVARQTRSESMADEVTKEAFL